MIENLWAAANPQAGRVAQTINMLGRRPVVDPPAPAPGIEALVKLVFDPSGMVMKQPPGGYGSRGANAIDQLGNPSGMLNNLMGLF